MAEIEIGPLSERLSDDEIHDLHGRLDRLGVAGLPRGDDTGGGKADVVDSSAMEELLDRLDAHDVACEIYVPVEFDGRVEVAGWRVGSVNALIDALDEVKDELDLEEEEDEEEEDEDEDEDDPFEMGAKKSELLRCWKHLYDGAQTALEQKLPLLVSV
jgi:hypothetical protein